MQHIQYRYMCICNYFTKEVKFKRAMQSIASPQNLTIAYDLDLFP